jgi:hypothetical protein
MRQEMEFDEAFYDIGYLPPLPVLDLGPAFNPDNFSPTPFGYDLGGFFCPPPFSMGTNTPPPPPAETLNVARRLSIKEVQPKRARVQGPRKEPSSSLLRRMVPPADEMRRLLVSFERLSCLRRVPTPCDSAACACDKSLPSSCTRPRSVTFVLQ